MKFLASRDIRIFLIAWVLYSVHFATNVVREHYPAFTIVDHGTFRVDEYQGFHTDIFVHTDGHSVIGNQVLVSVLAAVPLFIFDPILDALERHSKAKIEREGVPQAEYRVEGKPNRLPFLQLVKERGLDLRFGAATVVTTAFFMAPLTAWFLVLFHRVLRRRGVAPDDSLWLTALLGFGTPLFYRATVLGHNMFVMYGMFAAFAFLWLRLGGGDSGVASTRWRLAAGFALGVTLATDYIAVIILPLVYAYFLLDRMRSTSFAPAFRESMSLVIGSLPPIAFLLYSQWAMYGNPWYPGQHWMPEANIYVGQGARGFTLPDPELFVMNLFDPTFGLYTWAPLLLLALIPARRYGEQSLILPMLERRWLAVTTIAFLVFCSANQFSRLQFNSGFRYLLPLVPFMVLAVADHWVRFSKGVKWAVAAIAIANSWVIAAFREGIWESWRLFFSEGPQLPWYRVLSLTSPPDHPYLGTWWIPTLILGLTLAACWLLWRTGERMEAAHAR